MKSLKDLFDLNGRIAIVTGGAGHLGISMVETLAEMRALIVVCSRDIHHCEEVAFTINKKFPGTCIPMQVDVSETESVEQLKKRVSDAFGKTDILINNAYFGAGRDVLSMSEEDWKKGIDGSINSVYRLTKVFLPLMISQNSGTIINVSSMYGIVSPNMSIYEGNPFYNPANYGAGKAAILQFTRYIACVYGKNGIRCNAISPGPFPNPKTQEHQEFIGRLQQHVPLGRIGFPEDLKGAVALLASEASSYINGANIVVDGGWTAW
jgi:gluconate 5-dehydrogenase